MKQLFIKRKFFAINSIKFSRNWKIKINVWVVIKGVVVFILKGKCTINKNSIFVWDVNKKLCLTLGESLNST